MSYCRWSDGDLYAYSGSEGFWVHVAAQKVGPHIRDLYVEPTAQALLARILWLGENGCHYPGDALRLLKEDVVAEVGAQESCSRQAASV